MTQMIGRGVNHKLFSLVFSFLAKELRMIKLIFSCWALSTSFFAVPVFFEERNLKPPDKHQQVAKIEGRQNVNGMRKKVYSFKGSR